MARPCQLRLPRRIAECQATHFADEKGPEQKRRYMLSFQGPIVKGKTGFSMSVDGNNAYDSRTIVAQAPTGQRSTAWRRIPTDGMNANFRVDHLIGAGKPASRRVLAPQQRPRQPRRRRLRSAASAPIDPTTTPTPSASAITRVHRQEGVQRTQFAFDRLDASTTIPLSTAADRARQRRLHHRRRRPDRATATAARSSSRRTSTSPSAASTRCAPACCSKPAGGTATSARTAPAPTPSPASTRIHAWTTPPPTAIRVGDPLVGLQPGEGRLVRAGRLPSEEVAAGERRRAPGNPDADDATSGTSRRARPSRGTRRRRRRFAAATASSTIGTTRASTSRRFASTATTRSTSSSRTRVPGDRRRRLAPAGQRHPRRVARPADHPAGVDRARAADAPWADFRTDYMWTRGSNTLRSVNVNAPLDGVRPDPTVGNITEIQSTGKRAQRSLHR